MLCGREIIVAAMGLWGILIVIQALAPALWSQAVQDGSVVVYGRTQRYVVYDVISLLLFFVHNA